MSSQSSGVRRGCKMATLACGATAIPSPAVVLHTVRAEGFQPTQNISLSAKRNWRSVAAAPVISVYPPRAVIWPAALRVADVTVAPGLLKAGVLETLNASARN